MIIHTPISRMSSRHGYEAKGVIQKWIIDQQERIYYHTSETGTNIPLKKKNYINKHKVILCEMSRCLSQANFGHCGFR
jgi:hypothetical protein